MKTPAKTLLLAAGAAAFAFSTLLAMPGAPKKHGTDILHLAIRKTMHNEGVETNAFGRVDLKRNQQGHADIQRLDITFGHLATNETFSLFALMDDDTNLVQILDIDTDARGRAALHFRKSATGNGQGLGHGRIPLPDALNPITDIRELALYNGSTQAVLTADLTAPDRLQYLVKRDLGTNGVDALLRIKATMKKALFRLTASGLSVTNDYLLVLNDTVVQTNTASDRGRLNISIPLPNPAEILDLRTVALWDSVSNVVVSTELP